MTCKSPKAFSNRQQLIACSVCRIVNFFIFIIIIQYKWGDADAIEFAVQSNPMLKKVWLKLLADEKVRPAIRLLESSSLHQFSADIGSGFSGFGCYCGLGFAVRFESHPVVGALTFHR